MTIKSELDTVYTIIAKPVRRIYGAVIDYFVSTAKDFGNIRGDPGGNLSNPVSMDTLMRQNEISHERARQAWKMTREERAQNARIDQKSRLAQSL